VKFGVVKAGLVSLVLRVLDERLTGEEQRLIPMFWDIVRETGFLVVPSGRFAGYMDSSYAVYGKLNLFIQ
jgi:hypothetical protein